MTDIRKFTVAQVGCGYWGKNLVRNFAELGHLVAISDGSPDVAKNMSQQFAVPSLSWEQILADQDIIAVSLATPAATHAQMATEALRAGKHVFVEKPLALTSEDAAQMVVVAKDVGKTLMVGHLLQYHPIFRHLLTMVRRGEIGAVQYVFSNRMSLGKFRTEENVLWSFAPHDMSMILALVGQEPTYVTAQGASFVTPGIADWATVQLVFPSGARGHVQVSWASPYKEQRLVVTGSNGMLVFDDAEPDWDRKLALYRHVIDLSGKAPMPQKAEAEFIPVQRSEPLKDECAHFAHSVMNGQSPYSDGREGLRVLKVLECAESCLEESLRMTK